jgi:predicted glycosyltransferase
VNTNYAHLFFFTSNICFAYFAMHLKATKRILICPLNWGLGHASRCIPIIHYMLEKKHEVLIASSGASLALLEQEFPNLPTFRLNDYAIRYSKRFLGLALFAQLPKIALAVFREHQQIKALCKAQAVDVILSDNRFGCWNSDTTSIFITHQVFIPAPFFQGIIQQINFWFLRKYQQVWIPDEAETPNFSGLLSHSQKLPVPASYIGILSRFQTNREEKVREQKYKICVVLSGPEPQRTLLETMICKQISELKIPALLIRGLPDSRDMMPNTEYITFENHLATAQMQSAIQASEIVLCRSGYSSIMDLAALGKKAIFIPTPSQSEQEYLADYLKHQKICYTMTQDAFNLAAALQQSTNYTGFQTQQNRLDLSQQGF